MGVQDHHNAFISDLFHAANVKNIEKMIKTVSSHRAALYFDRGYLNRIIAKEGFSLVDELKSKSKGLSKNNKRKWQTKIIFDVNK